MASRKPGWGNKRNAEGRPPSMSDVLAGLPGGGVPGAGFGPQGGMPAPFTFDQFMPDAAPSSLPQDVIDRIRGATASMGKDLVDRPTDIRPPSAKVTSDSRSKADLAAEREAAKKAAERQGIEDEFGHDMAWLNEKFKYNPELLGKSARAGVYADPQLVAKQNQALDSLFGIARDGGASAQERARREGARADEEDWLRGQREADMADMAERGMSGSGQQILNLAADREAAAGRLNKSGLETDAWLEQRALDAMMGGGELAGKMRDTGFKEASDRATAEDEFSLLNNQALNTAASDFTQFQRDAWQTMLDNRQAWDEKKLSLGIDAAGGLMGSDSKQNQAGYDYSKDVASESAAQADAGLALENAVKTGARDPVTKNEDKLVDELGGFYDGAGEVAGSVVGSVGGAGGGGMPGGMPSGGGGGAPSGGGIYDEEEVFG